MKRNMFGALMTLVMAIVVNAPFAQAQNHAKANVPFSFRIGQQWMPAVEYEVRQLGDRATLIKSTDRHAKMIGLFNSRESVKGQSPKLVFNKIDNHYFLSQIWMHDNASGWEVPASSLEKELRLSVNQVPAGAETVVIALR